jgi:hypothetical protein
MLGSLIFSSSLRMTAGIDPPRLFTPAASRSWADYPWRIGLSRARYSLTTRAMVRYCVGAMPTWDEKKCVKWLCDEKPSSKPISVTEI